ncbi:hypothetical protein N7488_006269 [Penicillium malachiteum]|nr:hypothetical protein N7488_006269 [Penicillium malachiteum]
MCREWPCGILNASDVVRHQENNRNHHHSKRDRHLPKENLFAFHIPNISRVHAQVAAHERKRKKDRGHRREDQGSFSMIFLDDIDPLNDLEYTLSSSGLCVEEQMV